MPAKNPFDVKAQEAANTTADAGTEPTAEPMNTDAKIAAAYAAPPMPGQARNEMPVPGSVPMPGSTPMPGAQNGVPLPQVSGLSGPPEGAGIFGDDYVLDFTGVTSGGKDFIGAGRHLMYCQSVVQGIANNSGNQKLVVTYVVASGDYESKKVVAHLAITPNALWKIDEHTRALGITNADSRKPTIGQIKREAVGRLVVGDFIATTYNNSPSSDLARVYPPDELGIETGATIDEVRRGERMGR